MSAAAGTAPASAVIWHDLECGSYSADLALWRKLAAEASAGGRARVLDVGAGTGRVALALARTGHAVTALERDPELLSALRERGAGLTGLDPVLADARGFALDAPPFDACLVPMQTVQLLGGARSRAQFLRSAQAHLRPGGLLACAIVTELDEFDSEAGDGLPSPDTALVAGMRVASRPVRVAVSGHEIVIERERTIPALGVRERDTIALARLSAAQLEDGARRAGFEPQRARLIPATAVHVASEVVVARA